MDFQNLVKIEMTQNKYWLFGCYFETYNIFLKIAELWLSIARTYMVQISLQNSGGKMVFSGGGGSMEPPFGHQRE